MTKREFLMLAHPKRDKDNPIGMYASEKLDGNRAFWDGGITRGMDTETIPWAGVINPKTLQRKDKIKPVSTGLWSRYGVPIIAPDWWLDYLPPIPLDGEVWAGRGNFQLTTSIVKGDTPDKRWDQVEFKVFGSPSLEALFQTGTIKNPNMVCDINLDSCLEFLRLSLNHYRSVTPSLRDLHDDVPINNLDDLIYKVGQQGSWKFIDAKDKVAFSAISRPVSFEKELTFLRPYVSGNRFVQLLEQTKIECQHDLDVMLSHILEQGGEGVILRDPAQPWEPKRTHGLLKLKPFSDDEARIIGFTAGKGKYAGMIGALITEYQGKRLELSGMTDDERVLTKVVGTAVPGADLDCGSKAARFKIGDTVTFKFRELTDAGIPKEARYWRKAQ